MAVHLTDWSRSSFFDGHTELQTNVFSTPDPDTDDNEIEFKSEPITNDEAQTGKVSEKKSEKPVTDNPIMNELIHIMIARFEHLVDNGFLNPAFLGKIKNDPQEMLNFIRRNREVVGDQLNRRLDPKIRPTPQQLVQQGIVPKGYFTHGHEKAMKRKHRRKSTAQEDLAAFIQLRPKPEEMEAKGIISVNLEQKEERELIGRADDELNAHQDKETWEISILHTLLFKTISEALSASCAETQKQEEEVLKQMEEMNAEMKHLRDALDKYFLDEEPDVLLFAAEEEMIRDKFHAIQKKLLSISTKQNSIHEKLRILHSVESTMIDLQNIYDKELGQLRKTECDVLRDLKEQRTRRQKAVKIRCAEKSHCSWAMAKLHYTKCIASQSQTNSEKFIASLNGFLSSLQQISENQNHIVRDFDFAIDELESHLLNIRHDMSKVRDMTFKKIYNLHKQVEIAESLELGNRRLSVASATEIDRERRHFNTKIQRQLSTLATQIDIFNIAKYQNNLREIIDIQLVMSHNKLKAFFSVFTSCFTQTICDINICYQNLNCLIQQEEHEFHGNKFDDENKEKIKKLCCELYGINNVLAPITADHIGIVEKIIHCMKFIQIAKNALRYEMLKNLQKEEEEEEEININQVAVDTNKINDIIIIIARKLSIDDHTIDDIDRTNDDQLAKLAQGRVKSVFEKIIKCHDFNRFFNKRKPLNAMDVASAILSNVFGIKNNEENGDYLN